MKYKYPFYFQSAVHDCVSTCELDLSEYYGVNTTLHYLRNTLVTDPHSGTPLKNLLNLQSLFHAQLGKLVDVTEIINYFPFIAYLTRGHAVFVWGYSKNTRHFVMGGPGIGIIEVLRKDFFQQWDGLTAVIRTKKEVLGKNLDTTKFEEKDWIRFLLQLRSLHSTTAKVMDTYLNIRPMFSFCAINTRFCFA